MSAARKVVMWSSFVLSIRVLVRCVRVRGCIRARIGMRTGRLQTHKYIHIWCPLYSLASVPCCWELSVPKSFPQPAHRRAGSPTPPHDVPAGRKAPGSRRGTFCLRAATRCLNNTSGTESAAVACRVILSCSTVDTDLPGAKTRTWQKSNDGAKILDLDLSGCTRNNRVRQCVQQGVATPPGAPVWSARLCAPYPSSTETESLV